MVGTEKSAAMSDLSHDLVKLNFTYEGQEVGMCEDVFDKQSGIIDYKIHILKLFVHQV